MGRIITTEEFEEKKKGEEQRQRGLKPLKPVSLSSPVGELTLEDVEEPAPEKPKGLLDVLNEDIETNYHEYLKLQKTLSEFDTTLGDVPQSIKPSIIANYNKVVNKFNGLVTTLQTDVKKRDEIISVLKKQEFVTKKHLEGQEVSTQKTTRRADLQSSSILDKPSVMGGALGISQPLDLDKINKYVAAPLKGISHGIYSTPQAVGGLMRMLGENMQEMEGTPNIFKGDENKYTDLMKAIAKKPDKALYKPIDQWLIDKSQEIIKENREFLKNEGLYLNTDDKVEKWLFQLGSGGVSLGGAVGITLLTHNPHAAAVAFGMYQTGSMYQEAREADVKVSKATPLAVTAGVIEGALEYIGLEWLFTKYAGGRIANFLIHSAQEGFQEFSQELGQNVVAKVGWDKTRNLLEGCAESASIGAVLGGGASVITTNVEQSTDLTELTPDQRKGLIETIVEGQLKTMAKILPNLNPKTIMEKVKTDPDIQKAILGVFEAEQEVVTEAMKVEPKEPTTPEELEAKREMLRKRGVKENLLTDEFVKKAHITELPKADVTTEQVSEKTIEGLEKKYGKKTEKLTKKEVLEKVEKPKVEPKEPVIPTTEKKAEVEKVSPAKQEEEIPKVEINKDIKIKDVYTIGETTPTKKVKGKVREITGQTKTDKILIAELDILDLVLKGEAKGARKAFSEGQKKGIFKQKEHFEDVVTRAKERKAQKDYVTRLIKDINKLPTKNIAIDYKDKIEAIKDMFDLKKRQKKTLHVREETAKFIEREMAKEKAAEEQFEKTGELVYKTNLNIPQETIDIIKKIPLNDMTIEQLETVHDDIIHLANIGQTKDTMQKAQKGRQRKEVVHDLIATLYKDDFGKISQKKYGLDFKELNKKQKQDIVKDFQTETRNIKQEIKEISSIKTKIKKGYSQYWVNTTLDESLFEKMDGEEKDLWWETFYNTMNKCKNVELLGTFKKIEDSQNNILENKINIVKHLDERTGDQMLTHSQRVGVYLCSLDEDTKKYIQKVGIVIKKGLEPYKFTDKNIEDVVDSLTKEEKIRVKNYQEYQLTQGNELDKFDVRVRGVHLKKVKNRFGIQFLDRNMSNTAAVDLERNPITRKAYIEEGFRKERKHTAENIINIDSESNMLRDIAKVEHYKAYKEAEMDINNLLSDPELRKAIIRHPKYGQVAYDNIVQWFKDSVKAKQGKVLSTSDVVMNWFRTSAFISMLGLNVISGSKQLVSLSNAVALTDLRTVLSGIEQVALHYNETKQTVFKKDPQMKARKGTIDKIMQEWMESADAKQILTGVTGDIRMKQLFLIRALDEFAVLSVWIGTYNSVMNTHKVGRKKIKFKNAADLEKQAIEHAAYIVRKTQPFALMKDLPQWFRDGTVAKMFSLFQNQINKNQNLIRDTFRQFGAGKISTGDLAHRMIFGWFLPAALIGVITRGRPPEDWKELVGDMAVYYAGGWFFVGAIAWNIMQGYGGYVPAPIAFMQELIKIGTYKTTESKVKKGISSFCKVVGLSYNQPYRTIEGVEDWITGETSDARRLIWSKYVLGDEEKKYTPVKGKPSKPKKPGKPSKPSRPKKPKKP